MERTNKNECIRSSTIEYLTLLSASYHSYIIFAALNTVYLFNQRFSTGRVFFYYQLKRKKLRTIRLDEKMMKNNQITLSKRWTQFYPVYDVQVHEKCAFE
jgi:hypothetical protein